MKRRQIALVLALLWAVSLMPLRVQARSTQNLVLQVKTAGAANTYYYYNEAGQLLREMNEASMDVTDYIYREDGMLMSKTVHRYDRVLMQSQYDRKGDLYLEQEWTLNDDLIRVTRGAHEYDDLGRPAVRTYAVWSGDAQTESQVIHYSYHDEEDPESPVYCLQKTTFRAQDGAMAYASDDITFYDEEGRILGTHRYGEDGDFSAIYTYDSRGNVETYEYYRYRDEYAEEMHVQYSNRYNLRNQLISSKITYTKTVKEDRDEEGVTTEEVWQEEYRYDLMGHRVRLARSSTDGTVTVERRWKYDRWGNLLELTENGHLVEQNTYGPLKDALLEITE